MPLLVDVVVHRGDFTLDVQVSVADGETLALLGPNGAGKSTLLAAIAGLIAPEHGTIEVGSRVLTRVGTDTNAGVENQDSEPPRGRDIMLAPNERRVGLLGQDPLLFPHLDARENVAFGQRARGRQASDARTDADDWLGAVGLADFADRRPAQLSGGQQQRVAIARTLAAQPQVLLLDEPMAALDIRNASAVRTLLRDRLRASALPTIVVSHDVVDAMVLADRVAILDEGRIIDIGDTATVLSRPRTSFAAALVGLNLVHGTLHDDGCVRDERGRIWRGNAAATGAGTANPPGPAAVAGDSMAVVFPPTAVRVTSRDSGSSGSSGNSGNSGGSGGSGNPGRSDLAWPATVGGLEPAVRGIRVSFVDEDIFAELTPAEVLRAGIHDGMRAWVVVDPAFITVNRAR